MSEDNRNTYRCVSTSEVQQAVVKINGRKTVVSLSNQSAGGFLIESAKKLPARVGGSVLVRTSTGWSEVRVIRKEVVDGVTRLGLERWVDLPDPRDVPWRSHRSSTRRNLALLAAVVLVFLWSQMFTAGWFLGESKPLEVLDYFSALMDHDSQSSAASTEQSPNS